MTGKLDRSWIAHRREPAATSEPEREQERFIRAMPREIRETVIKAGNFMIRVPNPLHASTRITVQLRQGMTQTHGGICSMSNARERRGT